MEEFFMKHKFLWFLTITLIGLLPFYAMASSDEVPRVTKDELKEMMQSQGVTLIDVRVDKDWNSSEYKIKGAVRQEPDQLESWSAKYPKDKTIVLYCS